MRLNRLWCLVLLCVAITVGFATNPEEVSSPPVLDESFETGGFNEHAWILGGAVKPFLQSRITVEGDYALQFGAIGDDQESSIEIQVELHTPKWLSFFYKVSSEQDFDFLEFHINGQRVGRWSGNIDWEEYHYFLQPGQHTLLWVYIKDFSDFEGEDTAWIDLIKIVEAEEPPDLSEWMEKSGLDQFQWVLGGDVHPFLQPRETYTGEYALQFGAIGDDQESTIEIQVKVDTPHQINFFHKVSSEYDYDFFEFYVGEQRAGRWSGNTDWEEFSFYLPPGFHILQWKYIKDASESEGHDTAWIDQIEIVETIEPPEISTWLEEGGLKVFSWDFDGDAYPYLQPRTVYSGEFALQFGAIDDDQASTIEIQLELSEPQQLSFYHKVSSEMDFDFLEFYVNSQRVGRWSGNTDWRKFTRNLPQGQHTLTWTYVKDSSFSEGQDTAWIDRIMLGEAVPPAVRHEVSQTVDRWKTSTMVLVEEGKRIIYELPGDLIDIEDDEMMEVFEQRFQMWEIDESEENQVMVLLMVDDNVLFYLLYAIDEMTIETDTDVRMAGVTGRKVSGIIEEDEVKVWMLFLPSLIQVEERAFDLLLTIIATEEYERSHPGFFDRIMDSLSIYSLIR